MKLAPGTRLGPYAIDASIGAGGMGVVYRADDSRLGRRVAIKILPQAKGEHFRRYEREARTIGSLNHPNLITLHDVGEHDGVPFLVTELLEGESLRARLGRGPLPLREAIRIGADVARGLAAAHEAGVVHRDIKPDNIFITLDGRTKILDFGIAKLRRSTLEMSAVDENVAHEPTITPTTSETGVVIGTPGYMAPEQLDGGNVDGRTDIFALGVVLYEMITGRRAFASDNPVEESYAILKVTPDPPKRATKALARVVMRCLEKRKDARFQTANDLAFALDELDASTDPIARISKVALEPEVTDPTRDAVTVRRPGSTVATERVGGRKRWIAVAVLGAIAVGLAGVLVGRLLWARSDATTLAPAWPTIVEGGAAYRRVTYHTQPRWNARLATDGGSVLYTSLRAGREEVVRSQIAQPSILPTSVAGRLLDISSKGELAVLTELAAGDAGTLVRIFEGAGPRTVADRVTDAAWLPDGDGLAVIRNGLRVEVPLGTQIVERSAGKLDLLRVAPSGDRIAFAEHTASADTSGRVIVVDRSGKQLFASQPQTAIEGLAWSPDGREVWFSSGPRIVGLDDRGRERVVLRGGVPRLVLVDVRGGKILVAPSDIRLKMFTGPRNGPYREVGWFDSSEVEAVSADGATIAFIEAAGTGQNERGYAQFVRRDDQPATLFGHGYRFTMLPDASAMIVMTSATELQRVPLGVTAPTKLDLGKLAQLDTSDRMAMAWSGRHVVIRGAEAGAQMRLWRVDVERGGVTAVPGDPPPGRHPIAPDGALVAVPGKSGGVTLVPFEGAARSIAGPAGEQPLSFSADGTKLFVMHLVAHTIEVDRIDLATGAREPWTRITPEQLPVYFNVVLDADGNVVTYSTNSDASDLYVLEPPAAK